MRTTILIIDPFMKRRFNKREKIISTTSPFPLKRFPTWWQVYPSGIPSFGSQDYGPEFSPNLVVISSKRYQARPRFLLQLYQLERRISFLYCLVSKGRLWTDTIPLICINVNFSLPFPFPLTLSSPMSLVLNLGFFSKKILW